MAHLSRAEGMARTIEDEISRGNHSTGDLIGTKDALRRRYDVAAATVNEALKLLTARGVVESRPGPRGGVFVSHPSERRRQGPVLLGFDWERATIADYHEVRDALEPRILRHAAHHRTAGDLDELAQIVGRMRGALHDRTAYLRENTIFHRRVAAIGTNPPLRSLYVTVLDFYELTVDRSGLPDVLHPRNAEVHELLVAAIRSVDARQLADATRAHDEHRRSFGMSLSASGRPGRTALAVAVP